MEQRYMEYEDEELVVLAQNGDENAEEFLIRKYKDVVRSKAHLYFMVGADREDIMQEGMIGIFKAIRSYNKTRQASFHTFAEICINRQIITAIKRATRLKHSPLNTSVSLSRPISDKDPAKTLEETLSSNSNTDPEALFLLKEDMDYIEGNGADIFSDLELSVWNEYLQGKTYLEISEITGKSPKAIDNAIQRTKRKLELYLGR
ncbi:RNA polymerase sporulation sigma factor SigH [Sinanaerobacter chloroacetimidivorans]|uniref:RNA polymerase sigma factor SigS n=1 Tax=Sinanaerobacter chloroacetimidivorans TaxID=2818044 RepID=A0A8J8B0K6_9FIRM|nr:RNA polymerase sporulation sigma factor SigH [Sinanaerobacter chloroacetimidivorans]MBR0597279.1 RNA polymerase sporulation sigma factor SigH [Sinanaerobacter chloroacetimidivorans]